MPNGFQPVKDFLRKSVAAKTGGDWAGGYSSKLNDAMNQLTVSCAQLGDSDAEVCD